MCENVLSHISLLLYILILDDNFFAEFLSGVVLVVFCV